MGYLICLIYLQLRNIKNKGKNMKKISNIIICLLITCLTGCGSSVPKDWNIISKEDASKYYRSVEFTVDNVKDYFKITEKTEDVYNE